jgi:hypothetical protein
MQMYIILNTTSGNVCFMGAKPFIGQLKNAQDQADFLKSVNPEEDYVLAKVTPTTLKGALNKRYQEEHEKEKNATRKKRTIKAKSLPELPALIKK